MPGAFVLQLSYNGFSNQCTYTSWKLSEGVVIGGGGGSGSNSGSFCSTTGGGVQVEQIPFEIIFI